MSSSFTMADDHIIRRPPHILVVRNDKLGDFMLAWPALACLKATAPEARISVLVPNYTAPLAELCPWIDQVIIDPGDNGDKNAQRKLLSRLRSECFTALLTLFSTPRIGWLGWRARIPHRLAPATKWAQLFYNHRVVQRRSRSAKPEYIYNIELAERLLNTLGYHLPPRPTAPYWPIPPHTLQAQREAIANELCLDPSSLWLFLHAGSGGSAVNLTPTQYTELAVKIDSQLVAQGVCPQWLLTAGPGEETTAQALRDSLVSKNLQATVLPARQNLGDFALALATANLFIAGSTGPLHIAGCLNRPTAGFYPARRSATALRWQTCNDENHRLAFSPPENAEVHDMSAIDLVMAANAISALMYDRAASQSAS